MDVLEQVLEASGILESALGAGSVPGVPRPGDPGPDDITRFGGLAGGIFRPRPRPGPGPDPAVTDITRLNRVQLTAVLHNIAAEKARLDAMENLVNEQLAGGGQGPG